jgi:hypothetical protein
MIKIRFCNFKIYDTIFRWILQAEGGHVFLPFRQILMQAFSLYDADKKSRTQDGTMLDPQ